MTVLVTKPAVNIREALASLNEPQAISDVFGLQPALDAKQPLDADLTAIAALSSADGNIIVGSVSGWVAESGATARTSLGLGTGDSPTFTGVTATTVDATTAQADGVEITSASGDIDMLWASGSVHRVGSAYGGTYFTGMRVSADTRNVDLISLDASGLGNFRVFTGTSEVERLSINPSGTAAFSGNITVSGTVDTRDIATDGAKLDGIEAGADVTDTANVEAAGAVMDGDFTADGFMKRTGAGSYTVDTSTYLTEVAALNDIGDVTITGTPADNELLAYDTTTGAFINQTASEAGVAALSGATFTGPIVAPAGSVSAPGFSFTGELDCGWYLEGVGLISLATQGVKRMSITATGAAVFYGNVTATGNVSFGGAIGETVVALSGTTPAITAENGTILTHTLTGATTYTDSLTGGHSVSLHITAGANTVTWPTIAEWFGTGGASTAPTLSSSGVTVVVLWKVGSSLYGLLSGAN